MKALVVIATPCEYVKRLRPEGYLGYRLGGCPQGSIEHLLVTRKGLVKARKECENCVLARLARATHLLSPPVLTSTGHMKFLVTATPAAKRVLTEYRDRVVNIEEVDYRSVHLTPRQREAIQLLAEQATNITGLARALGVSKPAAWKLVRKTIRKIAQLYS